MGERRLPSINRATRLQRNVAGGDVGVRGGSRLPPGTRFVDAFVIDLNGIARGKRLPATDWDAALTTGVGFSASALLLDAQGNAQGPLGLGTEDGDPDSIGYVVPERIWPVPWAAENVTQAQLSMRGPDGPLWFDPRDILASVIARCHADGLYPVVACELEFYLVITDGAGRPSLSKRADGSPYGHAGHLCLQRVEDNAAFLHRLHDCLAEQGIAAGTLVSEYGPGQFEVNLRHTADPLLACDQAVMMRRATQGLAASLGQRATFMAKPYPEHPGNGLHVHMSIVDEAGLNRFGAKGGQLLLEQSIAGMQAMLRESMAIFAPSFSAYRRYRAGAFVAIDGAWGENDRRVAFRIPTGSASSRRIEHRIACADASPHLVMACILAAVHHGVTHRLVPGGPHGNPRDIITALSEFQAGTLLAGYLPAGFIELFSALKHAELASLLGQISDTEYAFYL
jgi:glutamine synthetase